MFLAIIALSAFGTLALFFNALNVGFSDNFLINIALLGFITALCIKFIAMDNEIKENKSEIEKLKSLTEKENKNLEE